LKKIQEQYASMNKKADPKPQPAPEAPTVAVEAPKPVEPVMPIPLQKAPEKPPEPTKKVEQEKVTPTNDGLIDDLHDMFRPAIATPVAQAPTEAVEPPKPVEPAIDEFYIPMAPEPLAEPENHKIDGDYSTYSNDELVEEFEWLQPRLKKSSFPGNSKRDIAGHREMDNIPENRNGIKTGDVKRQYEFREKLYNLFDEIKERDPAAAKQLEQAFKAQMANKRAVTFDLKPQLTK